MSRLCDETTDVYSSTDICGRDEHIENLRQCVLHRAWDAMEWRTVVVIVLVVSLCFFMIPIKVEPDKNVEDVKLFANYVDQYNKSYKNDSAEYKERFERFQVNDKSICQIWM